MISIRIQWHLATQIFLIMLLSSISFGWGSNPLPPTSPTGNEASLVEVTSTSEVMVKATGVGAEPELAEKDIELVAIQFVLLRWEHKMVTTFEEEDRLRPLLPIIYANPKSFVSWKAQKVLSTFREGSQFHVTRLVRVNKQELESFLVRNKVLASRVQLAKGVLNPEIAVIPEVPAGNDPIEVLDGNPLAKQCEKAITTYLKQRRFEVKSLRRESEARAYNQAKNREGDATISASSPFQNLAGADIYVQFDGRVVTVPGGRQVTLSITAIDASNFSTIGTETGYSQKLSGALDEALVEEATRDAIDKVIQQIDNFWKGVQENGIMYRLRIDYPGNIGDLKMKQTMAIRRFLRQEMKDAKLDKTDDSQDLFTIRVDPGKYQEGLDIFEALTSVKVQGLALKSTEIGRRQLILKAEKE